MISENIVTQGKKILKSFIKAKTQSGLSGGSLRKLRKYPALQKGTATLHGRQIQFTDAQALLHSVEEIFLEEVYNFEAGRQDPYIIDCGANIGLSVHYFKRKYPNSKILAFEPDPAVFAVLKHNVEQVWKYENVTLENKAIWHEESVMEFHSEGALAGSMVVNFGGKGDTVKVPVVDLRPYLDTQIDFLKIDIEGAENDLVPKLGASLGTTDKVFIEYHSINNEPQKLDEILSVMRNASFRGYIKEAAILTEKPFLHRSKGVFDMQLNMFFYR